MRRVHLLFMATLMTLALAPAGSAEENHAFARISDRYEVIRQTLIKDSTDGMAAEAAAIERIAAGLAADFSAAAAGVGEDGADEVIELLPEIIERTRTLAAARGLKEVREALAELTKPLVRYHRLVQGQRPVVVYCSMEKKAWLQPDEPVGNPYAPYMLRCGDVVSK